MSADRREKVVSLLATLPGTQPDSLRVFAHALLTLADDAGIEVLEHLGDQMPWIVAQLNLENGKERDVVASALHASHGFFPMSVLNELLATHDDNLTAIRELEDRLTQLRTSDSQTICDRAFQTSRELALFGHIPHFPEIPEISSHNVGALKILADIESRWERSLIEKTCLSERSKRFEISAVDHLAQSGFLASVRAALAFGDEHGIQFPLDHFTVFQDDHTLASLARALAASRGRVLDHLKGKTTLDGLSGWVAYLRGASADIANLRGITHKEALSFVHFSFHLMNMCDLMVELGEDTDDSVRRSIMAIEDGLKEFAAMRVLPAGEDGSVLLVKGLGLRKGGDVSDIADRLARLAGHWTQGTQARGLGGLGQLEVDICKPWLDVLVDRPMHERTRMADFLARAQFEGDVWEWLSPESSVNFLEVLSLNNRGVQEGLIHVRLHGVVDQLRSCSTFASELDHIVSCGNLNCFVFHLTARQVDVTLIVDSEVRAISDLLRSTGCESLKVSLRTRMRDLMAPNALRIEHPKFGDSASR